AVGVGVNVAVAVGVAAAVVVGVGVGVRVAVGVGVGVNVAVGVGVNVAVAVGVAAGVAVGVGVVEHPLITSTRRATIWSPETVTFAPVTRNPPPFAFATTEPRAVDWTVPAKTSSAWPRGRPSGDRSCTRTVLEFESLHLTR